MQWLAYSGYNVFYATFFIRTVSNAKGTENLFCLVLFCFDVRETKYNIGDEENCVCVQMGESERQRERVESIASSKKIPIIYFLSDYFDLILLRVCENVWVFISWLFTCMVCTIGSVDLTQIWPGISSYCYLFGFLVNWQNFVWKFKER